MRVRVGGTKLFFDVEGASLAPDGPSMRQRPTLVLLHGGPGGDHSEYKPCSSSLADCAQVVYLDHLGQGRSDPSDPSTWNLQSWAEAVHGFCEALEIERPVVLGASFGSFVALRYAIEYPEHPSKLILMATVARMSMQRISDAMARLGGEPQRAAAERFFTDPTQESESTYMDMCMPLYAVAPQDPDVDLRAVRRPEITRHFFRGEGMSFDHREGAARVRCPVLILNGDRDPVTPLDGARELAGALPADLVELVTIEGAAHDLSRDAPERVMPLLRRFMSS
jgi:pimeloyl-ACP methyl ester carboxylesterase